MWELGNNAELHGSNVPILRYDIMARKETTMGGLWGLVGTPANYLQREHELMDGFRSQMGMSTIPT